jgi:hypothetical protein
VASLSGSISNALGHSRLGFAFIADLREKRLIGPRPVTPAGDWSRIEDSSNLLDFLTDLPNWCNWRPAFSDA